MYVCTYLACFILYYVYIIFLVYIVLHNGCTVLKSLIV